MEPIIIKRSVDSVKDAAFWWLIISIIPIGWGIQGIIVHKFGTFDIWFFSVFIFLLLIIPLEGLIFSKLRLIPSITLSKEGIALSRRTTLYGSLAIMQRFLTKPDHLTPWNDIRSFEVSTNYEERPTGEMGGTVRVRQDVLCIRCIKGKTDHYYSIANLDHRPEKILELCKQFHQAYQDPANRNNTYTK